MKKQISYTIALILGVILLANHANAQSKKLKIGILTLDSRINGLDGSQLGNMARLELERLDTFEVLDRYDADALLQKEQQNTNACFSKECLINVGKILQADYMFSGTAEIFNNRIMVTLRMIDIHSQSVYRSIVKEFGNYPQQIQNMLHISICGMFNRPVDPMLYDQLTKMSDYENSVNQPNVRQIQLEGPRMGLTYLFGADGKTLASTGPGGFGLNPMMFQIGYQFEKQYLNSGVYQALFEFLPMVTGLDQSQFLPSIAFVNGLRNNKSGYEFGLGAIVALTNKANVRLATDNNYYLSGENGNTSDKPTTVGWADNSKAEDRFDRRGDPHLMTAIVLAVGKSFRSGNLNIPVNVWIMPQQDAFRCGISIGYNSSK